MELLTMAGAGLVLLLTVGLGTAAHEFSHAAVLYCFGIQCDIDIGPDWIGPSQAQGGSAGSWGVITPRNLSPDTTTWGLRLSALAPLLLLVPFVAVGLGIIPDPVQAGNPWSSAWAVGWLACAIPSPQDFSVFWHTDRLVSEHTTGATNGTS